MDDYSALAQRIAVNAHGVRGSLILSRDGLVLGAYPEGDESLAKPAWLKFVTLGEPDKSFVEFGDQVWAFVKRGGYAAFSVADAGTRPGILVDQMEQVLVGAEEGRASATPCGCPMRRARRRASHAHPCTHPLASPSPAKSPRRRRSHRNVSPRRSPPLRRSPRHATTASAPARIEPDADAPAAPAAPAEEKVPPAPASALKKEPQKLVSSSARER